MNSPTDAIALQQASALRPAGFWRRLVALFIDGLILAVCVQFPLMFFTFFKLFTSASSFSIAGMFQGMTALYMLITLAQVIYYVLFLGSRWQATPGKRLMGVYIATAKGQQRLTHARALARWSAFMGPTLIAVILQVSLGPEMFTKMMPRQLREQFEEQLTIAEKTAHGQKLTPEEQAFMNKTQADQQHWKDIREKQRTQTPLSEADRQFQDAQKQMFKPQDLQAIQSTMASPAYMIFMLFGLLCQGYWLAMVIAIAATDEKTGLHDLICGTRALKGRV